MWIMVVAMLLVASPSLAQIACYQYTGLLSCDRPDGGNVTIAPMGRNSGVITEYGNGKSTLEPYTILTPERPRRRTHDLDLEPLAPLPSLVEPRGLHGADLPSLDLPGLPDLELP